MQLRNRHFIGLQGGAKGWLIGEALSSNPKIVIFVSDSRIAEEIATDISLFSPQANIFILSAWTALPFEEVSPEVRDSAQRISTLLSLRDLPSYIVFLTPDALLQRSIPASIYEGLRFHLKRNSSFELPSVVDKLKSCGFNKTALVEEVGEFAVRSNIVDLHFDPTLKPIRLRFSDGILESIEHFDAESQRTTDELEEIAITPVREIVPAFKGAPFHSRLGEMTNRIKERGKILETPPREIARAIQSIKTESFSPGQELFQLAGITETESVLDFVPDDATLILHDSTSFEQMLYSFFDQVKSRYDRMKSEHRLIPELNVLYSDPDPEFLRLKNRVNALLDSIHIVGSAESKTKINLKTISLPALGTKLAAQRGSGKGFVPLRELIDRYRERGSTVMFVIGSQQRAERLNRLLMDLDVEGAIVHYPPREWLKMSLRPPVAICLGHLSQGFELPDESAVFIAEQEVFSEKSFKKSSQKRFNLKRILSALAQLSEGDFVVHTDFGIGKYRGLTHLSVEGSVGDFLFIEYADSTLYLPVHNIARVQKFTAAEGQLPKLDKLASTRWVKTKAKVRESVAQLAGDLIRLYAARSVAKGWRFEPFGAEDERFSDGFPYNETPDQLKAIEDALADMSQDRVMDRLVCGDVGFGKTEVAIRAAFKCVQHRRQVAVLCPTTILVEQHKRSFQSRFEGYETQIASMSRFNTPQENKTILKAISDGSIDIVIGTHRLLSHDVNFADLGLLIIDEEHRFGVKQKERLKSLKKSVDVLTLTATPIPRTLHMSLLGIRDISVISTPPIDRRMIRTFIANQEDSIIRDAILREIQRGGQVFVLHNRIESIDLFTAGLQTLVPEAKFQFAHGQMSEAKLETIMSSFIEKEFDVLVSTTIIESGIDIPNANTIIIERADTYGLAQLYQLRGRVGRSARQGFAYLLVPKARSLTQEAQKRLKALQALDDLGLGFNLALRDMEIRGAGNLLGKEQSGSVAAVGFDLYTKILNEAVLNLKGEDLDLAETIEPDMKLGVSAFIPDWYLPDVSERLILYQRLSSITNDEDARDLAEETRDRFGDFPVEVESLIDLMRLRAILRRFGCVRIELRESRLLLAFHKSAPLDLQKILDLCRSKSDHFQFSRNLTLSISLEPEHYKGGIYSILGLTSHTLEAISK